MKVLEADVWRELERAHETRVDALTASHRTRRAAGVEHPVEDFLFTYYNHSPGALRRWHPGVGTVLRDAASTERATWRFYRTDDTNVTLDIGGFLEHRGDTVLFVRDLLLATLSRPATLGCFGLHEWAMVYRLPAESIRHDGWPLRLGSAGTDDVVDAHQLTCSHFDAYRFFTPQARPANALQPTRDTQVATEQPGCLHAGMDVYKWAYKLTPAVPSDLVADSFGLAREIRLLDMRAAPYDLRVLGVEPVQIETRAGKAAYLEAQRSFVPRANALRRRLVAVCDALLTPVPTRPRARPAPPGS